mmetsp:Transcript_66109/g.193458  ORF Transcript_66109/g.193458 Transcript_66109/m.193458 type:complete len:350 (-) Transcript_66109:108-1157(-)
MEAPAARSAAGALLLLLMLSAELLAGEALILGEAGTGSGSARDQKARVTPDSTGSDWDRWGPVPKIEGMPQVVPGRSYVFITHHKTGTNLMQRFCNLTARLTTAERDQCAFCFRVLPPIQPGGPPWCVPDPIPVHGPLRGTFSRFTIVSNIDRQEYKYIQDFAPDFRAVHMVRDPVEMALSAYAYNTYLETPAGKNFRWDESAKLRKSQSLPGQLRAEARAILPKVEDMGGTDELAFGDSRTLTLDLDTFSQAYDAMATRLFSHLFDTPPSDQLTKLVQNASAQDTSRWSETQKNNVLNVAPRMGINEEKVEQAWRRLAAQGDPSILKVESYQKALGYVPGSERWEHPI